MNKTEFLDIMERSLGSMSQSDKSDILYDYREHFSIGLGEGKTEEEICSALGDPKAIAKQYRVNYIVRNAEENRSAGNILRAVFAALSLGFFNLVFMLPVFFSLVAVVISLYASAFAISLSGAALFFAAVLKPFLPDFISMPSINAGILIFTSIGLASLGLMFIIGCSYVTKFFYFITMKYIKANINIIGKK